MDGFSPDLNLANLPGTPILVFFVDLSRTQRHVARKPSTTSGLSNPGLCVPQMTEAFVAGTSVEHCGGPASWMSAQSRLQPSR